MTLTQNIAKLLRDVHFGGNWTWVNLQEHLSELSWQDATTQVYSLNSIAMLVFHMNFYLNAVASVVKGMPLAYKHEDSLKLPPISSQQEWKKLLDKTWSDVEEFATLIEQMPESKLWETFREEI